MCCLVISNVWQSRLVLEIHETFKEQFTMFKPIFKNFHDWGSVWTQVFRVLIESCFCKITLALSGYHGGSAAKTNQKYIHGQDLMAVVGFLGSLAVFWRLFFLALCQSLWPASSEDSTLCSGVVGLAVQYLWLWDRLLSFCVDGWLVCLVWAYSTRPQGPGITIHKRPANDTHQPQWQIISSP